MLVDAEGRQYEVLTPQEGGGFDGGDVTLTSEPGVVPNGEIMGVRVDAAGPASNIGKPHHRYVLAGLWHVIRAVDADGAPVSDYALQAPLRVCLPLPPELRSNISNVVIVTANPDDFLTVLAASVRFADGSSSVCANLSELPATVAVGRQGSPADLPPPTPDPDEPETPDTGGVAPTNGAPVLFLILGAAVTLVGVTLLRRRTRPKRIS